jgi:nucleoside-diphosphate-sugar epimerase
MLNEFILMMERHVRKRAKIKLMPAQPSDVPFTNADVSKAKMLLGYVSKVSIEEGVRRTVWWFENSQSDTRTEDKNMSQMSNTIADSAKLIF